MIKYRLMKMAKQHPHVKLSLDVMVEPEKTRLPTKEELAEVAKQLQKRRGRLYGMMFVCFYLPDMVIDAGAFATAHYRDGVAEEVRIMLFHIPEKWQHLTKERSDDED